MWMALFATAVLGAETRLPKYQTETYCEAIAELALRAGPSDECVGAEDFAYTSLQEAWPHVSNRIKESCIKEGRDRGLFGLSYSVLLECLGRE
jgi:hypothetical protein